MIREDFYAKGTTCGSCAEIIRRQAMKIDGVKDARFDYAAEKGFVVFDAKKTNLKSIFRKVEEKGYTCSINNPDYITINLRWVGGIVGVAGILIISYYLLNLADGINVPAISQNMGYGLLFIVGLLTGIHCVSMCGGFVISYSAKTAELGLKPHRAHIMYAVGKVVSYTLIGAAFGLFGSIIAFTPLMRGVAGLVAGSFLILYGLKMLNVIPALRRIQLKVPRSLARFVGKESKTSSPLVIGLLNGLMIACGPLQAIYIMAAGTGSVLEGGKLLFIFALGTLPVMLGFGYLTTYVSSKMTNKILKASGVIVIALGLFMINNGLALTGSGYDFNTLFTSVQATSDDASLNINNGYQEIRMEVNSYGWEPDKFVLKKGVPVRWIIDGKEINGCNNAIQVPKLGLKFDIRKGEQVIEFTPEEEGVIPWSCWMGMIPGVFVVKDDIDLGDTQVVEKALNDVPEQRGGSCGAAGGGCGCGGRG
ncbi:MAG: sulfite exporter TauE/SafE family protein [archaeon]